VGTLSNALIADIAFIIGSFYTHSEIDNLFMRRGAPDESPPGSKLRKTEAWLMIANEMPSFDMVSLIGRLLEDLMDREARGADRPKIERAQADVRRACSPDTRFPTSEAASSSVPRSPRQVAPLKISSPPGEPR